jgi:hypothetical protein
MLDKQIGTLEIECLLAHLAKLEVPAEKVIDKSSLLIWLREVDYIAASEFIQLCLGLRCVLSRESESILKWLNLIDKKGAPDGPTCDLILMMVAMWEEVLMDGGEGVIEERNNPPSTYIPIHFNQ